MQLPNEVGVITTNDAKSQALEHEDSARRAYQETGLMLSRGVDDAGLHLLLTQAKWDDNPRARARAEKKEQDVCRFWTRRKASPRLSLLGMSCRLSVAERSMGWNPYKCQTLRWRRLTNR